MRVVLCVVVWFFSMFSGVAQATRPFDVLPQTGQTKCYDPAGVTIPCADTGQDGELKKGIPWPNPRFVDHGNGTITDMLTGLMWLKDANCAHTISYNPDNAGPFIGAMSWFNAIDFVKKMNARTIDACGSYAAGYTDWRLPTPRELESLINYGATNNFAWLTNRGFLNVKARRVEGCINDDCPYWTATTQVGIPGYAVAVELEFDSVGPKGKSFDHWNPGLTWPVRINSAITNPPAPVIASGQVECYDEVNDTIPCVGTGQDGETQAGKHWAAQRFIDHGDGTATDVFTNLMWLKAFPTGNAEWQYALDYVKGMNNGLNQGYGYTDWYIPNVHEALSLVSWEAFNVALPSGHPFDMMLGNASWASTSSSYSKSMGVFADYYRGGQSNSGGKIGGGFTYLPVRSLMFRNAVGNFYKKTGKTGGQCVLYVRNETHLPWTACNGPAYQCFSLARDAGHYTGSVPRVGSIIVFGQTSKMPDGHVGIVMAINWPNVTLRDSNWKLDEIIREHTVDVTSPSYVINGYIYP